MPSQAVTGSTAFKLTLVAQVATAASVLGAVGLFVLSPDAGAQSNGVTAVDLDTRVAGIVEQLNPTDAAETEETYEIDPAWVSERLKELRNAPTEPEPETTTGPEPTEGEGSAPPGGGGDDSIVKLYTYLGMVSMTGADGAQRRLALIKLNDLGTQRMVAPGTDLGDGRVLAEIGDDAVVFEVNGARTSLDLAERTAISVSTATSPDRPNAAPSVGQNRAGTVEDEATIQRRLQNAEESRRRALERARELRDRQNGDRSSSGTPVRPQSRLGLDGRGSNVSAPANTGAPTVARPSAGSRTRAEPPDDGDSA